MREKTIEQYFAGKVKAMGGLCMKFVSPGLSGVPDRLVLYNGAVCFVELKAPGKHPRNLQKLIHARIREQGAEVFVVDSYEKADAVVRYLQTIQKGGGA